LKENGNGIFHGNIFLWEHPEKPRSSLRTTVDNSFEIRSGSLQRSSLERYNYSSIFNVLFIIIQQYNAFNEKEIVSL
jgi:hypothetical protein